MNFKPKKRLRILKSVSEPEPSVEIAHSAKYTTDTLSVNFSSPFTPIREAFELSAVTSFPAKSLLSTWSKVTLSLPYKVGAACAAVMLSVDTAAAISNFFIEISPKHKFSGI